MKRFLFPLILFLLVILQGVALELLPSSLVLGDWMYVPHWAFTFLIYMVVFYDTNDTYYSLVYALIFGLLIDVVYTGVLGVYMFSYALVIYIIHIVKKILHGNFFVLLLLGVAGIMLADLAIYIIYMLVGLIDIVFKDYIFQRMLPTALSNLIFILLIYPFTAKRLSKWSREQLNGTSSL